MMKKSGDIVDIEVDCQEFSFLVRPLCFWSSTATKLYNTPGSYSPFSPLAFLAFPWASKASVCHALGSPL